MGMLGLLGYTFDRVAEITLGSVVGIAVVTLIVPARAYVERREAAAEAARLLADIMTALARAGGAELVDLGALPPHIEVALTRLATADDAARERRSRLSDHPDPELLFRTLRRLQNDILALHQSFNSAWPEPVRATLAAPGRPVPTRSPPHCGPMPPPCCHARRRLTPRSSGPRSPPSWRRSRRCVVQASCASCPPT